MRAGIRLIRPSLALLALGALVAPTLAAPVSAQEARGPLTFKNGDLITANGRNDSLIRLRAGERRLRAKKIRLDTRLKPKGLHYSKFCEKVAIANSINVVVYDAWTKEVEVIEDERFGLIADVQWDMGCNLLIADMGRDSVGRWPRDGKLWKRDPAGEIWAVAGMHKWSNPAFLEMDEWGVLYVVDKSAGRPIPGPNQWHYDAIYKLGAPDYRRPKLRFRRKGLEVTAFLAHPDGRFFIGNGDELLVLEGMRLSRPCGGGGFTRINGLALDPWLQVFAVDGFDTFGGSSLYRVGDGCDLDQLASGPRINGSQGLAAGLPAR